MTSNSSILKFEMPDAISHVMRAWLASPRFVFLRRGHGSVLHRSLPPPTPPPPHPPSPLSKFHPFSLGRSHAGHYDRLPPLCVQKVYRLQPRKYLSWGQYAGHPTDYLQQYVGSPWKDVTFKVQNVSRGAEVCVNAALLVASSELICQALQIDDYESAVEVPHHRLFCAAHPIWCRIRFVVVIHSSHPLQRHCKQSYHSV